MPFYFMLREKGPPPPIDRILYFCSALFSSCCVFPKWPPTPFLYSTDLFPLNTPPNVSVSGLTFLWHNGLSCHLRSKSWWGFDGGWPGQQREATDSRDERKPKATFLTSFRLGEHNNTGGFFCWLFCFFGSSLERWARIRPHLQGLKAHIDANTDSTCAPKPQAALGPSGCGNRVASFRTSKVATCT